MEQFSNAAQSVLAANVAPTDTTLTVVSAAGFPTSGNFRLLIDQEILLVTGVSGTTFTVTRAVEPVNGVQVAAGHGVGALVTSPLTVASLALYPLPGSGTVTSVATGTGLTGGPITTAGTVALANTAVTAASYGDATHVPQVTIDAQGRITAAANVAIGGGTVTSVATGTGLTGGPITTTGTVALANTAVTPGSYGDATHVAQVTIDAQGRLTAAANVLITGGGGGVTIGNPVTGGTASTLLYIDASGNLASSALAGITPSGSFGLNIQQPTAGQTAIYGHDSTGTYTGEIGHASIPGVASGWGVLGHINFCISYLCFEDTSGQQWPFFATNGTVTWAFGDSANSLIWFNNVAETTGGNTATLNNSPTAGDPTGWLQISKNGTLHYIPYW